MEYDHRAELSRLGYGFTAGWLTMVPIAGLEQAARTIVLVHADDRLTRTGLLSMVSAGPRIAPVLSAEGTDVDVTLVASTSLTSSLMRQLRSHPVPRPPCVLVLDQLGDVDIFAVLELGVRAILWRPEATGERVLQTIRVALHGGVQFPVEVQEMLVDAVVKVQQNVLTPRRLTASGLEDREIDVIRLIAQGFDTGEVARRLAYSERTVKTILSGMVTRLNLRSRSHAVAYAIRSGLL